MDRHLFKARTVTYTIAFGLMISAFVGMVLYLVYPLFDWNWFVAIVLFFLILEPLMVSLVAGKSGHENKKQMVNIYMLTKVIRVIASLIFITVYALMIKQNMKAFVAVFISFYLLYLTMETILFVYIEKRIKEKNSSDE